MTLLCVVVAKAGMATSQARYFGLLGLLQVAIGVRKLYGVARPPKADEASGAPPSVRSAVGYLQWAAATIGGFGDNFSVYVPLFMTTGVGGIGTCLTVFAIMTGLLCLGAHWLVARRVLRERLQFASHLFLPWMLIALGIFIAGRAIGGAR